MAIRAPHRRTPAQAERDNARLFEKAVSVYDLLNTSDIQKRFPVVYGARLGDTQGHVYIQLDVEDVRVYIHAVPWSRGYSIFVHTKPEVTAMDWRTVDAKFEGLQKSLYAPRGSVGAWHVPNEHIVLAMIGYATVLHKYEVARGTRRWARTLSQYFNKFWGNNHIVLNVYEEPGAGKTRLGGTSWVSLHG